MSNMNKLQQKTAFFKENCEISVFLNKKAD